MVSLWRPVRDHKYALTGQIVTKLLESKYLMCINNYKPLGVDPYIEMNTGRYGADAYLACWCFRSYTYQDRSSRVDGPHNQWSVHWRAPLFLPGSRWWYHPYRLWLYVADPPIPSSTCSCRDKTLVKHGTQSGVNID